MLKYKSMTGIEIVTHIQAGRKFSDEDNFFVDYYRKRKLNRLEYAMPFHEICASTDLQNTKLNIAATFGAYFVKNHGINADPANQFQTFLEGEALDKTCNSLADCAVRMALYHNELGFEYVSREEAIQIRDEITKEFRETENNNHMNLKTRIAVRLSKNYFWLHCVIRPEYNYHAGLERSLKYGLDVMKQIH